jgi:hypothetical protein
MKICKENALRLWDERYGNKLWVEDFDGGLMYRNAYNSRDIWAVCTFENRYTLGTQMSSRVPDNQKIYCGWNLHHILPKVSGGTDEKDNLICTNIITNDEAGDKTTFWIEDCNYQVKWNQSTGRHEIVWLNP